MVRLEAGKTYPLRDGSVTGPLEYHVRTGDLTDPVHGTIYGSLGTDQDAKSLDDPEYDIVGDAK